MYKVIAIAIYAIPTIFSTYMGFQTPVKAEEKVEVKVAEVVEVDEPESTDLFDKYFGAEANIARAICTAESGLDAKSISPLNKDGSRDHGLCQINDYWQRDKYTNVSELLDEENNIRITKQIRDEWGNWNAWSTYKSGKYKQY